MKKGALSGGNSYALLSSVECRRMRPWRYVSSYNEIPGFCIRLASSLQRLGSRYPPRTTAMVLLQHMHVGMYISTMSQRRRAFPARSRWYVSSYARACALAGPSPYIYAAIMAWCQRPDIPINKPEQTETVPRNGPLALPPLSRRVHR